MRTIGFAELFSTCFLIYQVNYDLPAKTKVSCNNELPGFSDPIIGTDRESEMLRFPQAFPL